VASAPGAAADIAGMMADIKRVRESCEVGKLENAEGTPLGAAVRYGSLEIVQALIAAKANLNARQSQWQTPLMIAMANGRADVARALLDAGADPLLQDNRGRTAAMLAAGN
jgi:ankyrin repeat protein